MAVAGGLRWPRERAPKWLLAPTTRKEMKVKEGEGEEGREGGRGGSEERRMLQNSLRETHK